MPEYEKRLYDEVPFDAQRPYELGGWRKLPEIVHNDVEVKGFFGEYRWLSNFGPAIVQLDGVTYPSVEVAYQAAKWAPNDRDYFNECSSKESISYNRENTPDFYTEDAWESTKVDVMYALLQQKYDPAVNPENAQRLAETGYRYLEETNWWGDRFWGKDLQGEGLNTLGELIMIIRGQHAAPTIPV